MLVSSLPFFRILFSCFVILLPFFFLLITSSPFSLFLALSCFLLSYLVSSPNHPILSYFVSSRFIHVSFVLFPHLFSFLLHSSLFSFLLFSCSTQKSLPFVFLFNLIPFLPQHRVLVPLHGYRRRWCPFHVRVGVFL